MGWNDHDPAFTGIQNAMDEYGVDYDTAVEFYVESMMGDY